MVLHLESPAFSNLEIRENLLTAGAAVPLTRALISAGGLRSAVTGGAGGSLPGILPEPRSAGRASRERGEPAGILDRKLRASCHRDSTPPARCRSAIETTS